MDVLIQIDYENGRSKGGGPEKGPLDRKFFSWNHLILNVKDRNHSRPESILYEEHEYISTRLTKTFKWTYSNEDQILHSIFHSALGTCCGMWQNLC